MRNDFFKFPQGTEVEFILSRNRLFDNLILKGKVDHYSKKFGWQTVRQNKRVKNYPVNLVHIHTDGGREFTVDVDCIKTKPTQAMVNKVNERAERAILDKERPVEKPKERLHKRQEAPAFRFKMRDAVGSALTWAYIASKNSKKFHSITSPIAKRITTENVVKFFTKKEAEASGRSYVGK